MDSSEFKHDLLQDAKVASSTSGEGTCASFVSIIAEYLSEGQILPDFTPSFYEGKNGRYAIRIDGFHYDEFDGTAYLVIADYDDTDHDRTLINSVATKSFDKLKQFLVASVNSSLYKTIEMSTPVYDIARELKDKFASIHRIRLFLFTDATKSSQIKEIEQDSFNGVQIEKQIWDIERVFKLCCMDDANQAIEINFEEYMTNGIPCLDAGNFNTNKYKSYLGVIPGAVLADIYDKYGSKLLESNVRSFLSTKVSVNKKIRTTLISTPEMFFAFNNGISVTAKEVKLSNTPDGIYISSAKDFQIINGGQTTASISSARYKDKADLSKVFVQMKLTDIQESSGDESEKLIKNISRSSNSQNKVSDADFFASHAFHRTMEQISRHMFAPPAFGAQYETKWFYERARGQYVQEQMKLTKAKKIDFKKMIPKDHVIKKTDLAKVQNTWLGNPHVVSKGAQSNFTVFADYIDKEWDRDCSQFNERYYQSTVALIIIFQYLEKAITQQNWYQGGYRANVIYYTVALFHHLIKKKYPSSDLDLIVIWKKQDVPDPIKKSLLELSEKVLDNITSKNYVANVTQWCKKVDCWNLVKNISYDIDGIEAFLISDEEEKKEEKSARRDQREVNKINDQSEVVTYGAANWKRVYDFALGNGLVLLPSDVTNLRLVIQNKVPSSKQSKNLLSLLERVIEEGFPK